MKAYQRGFLYVALRRFFWRLDMSSDKNGFFDRYLSKPEREWEVVDRKIDRNGQVYHVFQRGRNREQIFTADVAKFRHNMLCKLCADHGVVIIFSVVMPNHTHDVLAAAEWKTISNVMKTLNTKVSQYIRKRSGEKYKDKGSVFDGRPTYKPVRDRVYLFYLGKYLYDNPAYLVEAGRFVPYSCFWMFEKGYLVEPYRKELYIDLLGMTAKELVGIYSFKSKEEVYRLALERFSDWPAERNDAVFKLDCSIPWVE